MPEEKNLERRTGRRRAVDIDSPRDKTVCFMVSELEKQLIDDLCFALGKTRSSILTRIVVSFIEGTEDRKNGELAVSELIEFLDECQSAFAKQNNKKTNT